jgi:hypothetical protein
VGVSFAPDAWSHLFRNMGRSRDLILLDLFGNRLDMAVVQSLTVTLAAHGSKSSLGLSCCGLNDRTASALASGLAGIAAMKMVDLFRNDDMTDAVVVYLNKLLSLNKSITELNAHGCGFGGRSMGGFLLRGDEQGHLSGGGRLTKGQRGCAIVVFERMEEVPLEYAVIFFLFARQETPSSYTSRS